jgi:DNA-binding NarL/FixJ family response regulator
MRTRSAAPAVDPLTERELEVLALVGRGLSNKEIATDLGITERTARTHVSNILGKLGLASRTQAALYAVDRRLVTGPD